MRRYIATSLICTCLFSAGIAQAHSSSLSKAAQNFLPSKNDIKQVPFGMAGSDGQPTGDLIISDVLGRERKLNIFSGLIRDVDSVSQQLRDVSSNATILAPLNSELTKMERKPWEDPADYQAIGPQAYEGSGGKSRAQENLQRFVEAHIIPQSPWKPGTKATTWAGTTLELEEKDGKQIIQPGNIEVEGVADTVANGQVWMIRGVLNRK